VRGLIDLYFDWHAANLLNLTKYAMIKGGFSSAISLEEAKTISDAAWKELERVFLSQRRFLATNNQISVADLALSYHLAGLLVYGYELSPRVREYHRDVVKSESGLKESIDKYLENQKEAMAKRASASK